MPPLSAVFISEKGSLRKALSVANGEQETGLKVMIQKLVVTATLWS